MPKVPDYSDFIKHKKLVIQRDVDNSVESRKFRLVNGFQQYSPFRRVGLAAYPFTPGRLVPK